MPVNKVGAPGAVPIPTSNVRVTVAPSASRAVTVTVSVPEVANAGELRFSVAVVLEFAITDETATLPLLEETPERVHCACVVESSDKVN
jgi:hypothetical protein